jgi:hypothetical protein
MVRENRRNNERIGGGRKAGYENIIEGGGWVPSLSWVRYPIMKSEPIKAAYESSAGLQNVLRVISLGNCTWFVFKSPATTTASKRSVSDFAFGFM